MWFRRDLRLADNPALLDSLRALDAACAGMLVVRHGDPRVVVPHLAQDVGADEVHVAASHEPYGRRRHPLPGLHAVPSGLARARLARTGSQGRKFDPDGVYVRRWVPELRDVPADRVQEPWRLDEPPSDYPAPIVDHAVERRVALDDLQRGRS